MGLCEFVSLEQIKTQRTDSYMCVCLLSGHIHLVVIKLQIFGVFTPASTLLSSVRAGGAEDEILYPSQLASAVGC